MEKLQNDAVALLKELIMISSFSREEDKTADVIEAFLQERKVKTQRQGNNI